MARKKADRVGALIAEYRRVQPDANGNSYRRSEIIRSELWDLPDERILPFLVEVVGDEGEFHLARIEALQVLPLKIDDWNPPPQQRAQAAGVLVRVMLHDADPLVRSYAAMAMYAFRDVPGVLPAVMTVLQDEEDDINLLHNAFSALDLGRPFTKERLDMVACFLDHPELGPYAERILREHTKPGKRP
jgi:hypothetical protein